MILYHFQILLSILTSGVLALQHGHHHAHLHDLDRHRHNKRGFNNGIQLRILPLGASIVYGQASPDGNGFRYGLRNQLIYNGNPVNMIGSVHTGTMADGDCEGWPGFVITQVAAKAESSISSQPNLVLLHVGTNDCVQGIDIQNAGARLGGLIDRLFSAIPGVTIIASTLLPNSNANTQANVKIFNSQIPGIVASRQAAGKKITYVDFSSTYFGLPDIGADGTHPTADGYMKMAEVWYQGIQAASVQGWLSAPATVSGVSDTVSSGSTTCDKIPGAAIGPTQTQMGSGGDDGAYTHVGKQVDGFAGWKNPSPIDFNNPLPEGVFWGDIDGDGIDDYIYVGKNINSGLGVALSLGGGKFGTYLYIPMTIYCNRPGVWFKDMTGDGRDDLCCLGPDGGLICWQNTKGSDSRSPNWVSMGTVKSSEGYPQAQVRLADIDGDGRTDYVVFDADSTNIYGWRNGALQNGAPGYWYAMRGVISGLPSGNKLSGYKFVDLNGDKRDELVWVSPNGQVTTWINRRGFSVGLGPQWVAKGVTHQGSDWPVNVTFGAFMGSGRADYALGSIKNGNVYVDRWQNNDYGGTMVRADGSRYCDMTGTGSDDYVWISATGEITLYENNHNWGYWSPWGVIYNVNRARQEIHLADFDGDRKCDILLVDRASGATSVIKNNYTPGKFAWSNLGVVTGGAFCSEGYGSAKHDLGVRWHDIDGDGRADFLCIQTNGVVSGYLNKGVNNMVNQGMIKHAEGKERKNLRFADINGDGRDDFLYVNMINGAVTAWYNGGPIPSSGSAFQWNWHGNVSTGGSSRGSCVEFGALYGLGRADYIVVEPATNKAWTWFNVCPDGLGPVNPNLPSGAPPAPVAGSKLPSGVSVIKTTATINSKTTVLTQTVVPTTTTDSRGVIIVGTITQGPQPTTPISITSLKTYTTFPTSVTWRPTTVSYNTHDGSTPILGPWPLCWFCPPGSGGIVLSGFLPGVYPAGGPPPGLPTPFPKITIWPDGTPQYSSKDDSCETVTVTNHWVSCDGDRTSCTTTSSATLSGCNAKSTAYTTAPTCGDFLIDDDDDYGANGVPPTRPATTTATTTRPPIPSIPTPSSFPTATAPWSPSSSDYAFCYAESSGLTQFSVEDYNAVTTRFCDNNFLLQPGRNVAYSFGGNGYNVVARADWASDQTGCAAQKTFSFASNQVEYEDCRNVWLGPYHCNGEDTAAGTISYGGAYVLKPPTNGCILFSLYAEPATVPGQQNKRAELAAASTILPSGGDNNTLVNGTSTDGVFSGGSVELLFAGNASAITWLWTLANVSAIEDDRWAY